MKEKKAALAQVAQNNLRLVFGGKTPIVGKGGAAVFSAAVLGGGREDVWWEVNRALLEDGYTKARGYAGKAVGDDLVWVWGNVARFAADARFLVRGDYPCLDDEALALLASDLLDRWMAPGFVPGNADYEMILAAAGLGVTQERLDALKNAPIPWRRLLAVDGFRWWKGDLDIEVRFEEEACKQLCFELLPF